MRICTNSNPLPGPAAAFTALIVEPELPFGEAGSSALSEGTETSPGCPLFHSGRLSMPVSFK